MENYKKTILIVDDELELLENLVELFQLSGFEVLSASNGLDGLQKIKNATVDLIICDINMPKMSGFEFLENLNAQNHTRTIPIIFLSAHFSDEDEKRLINNGSSACLPKGIPFSEILNFIQSKIFKL